METTANLELLPMARAALEETPLYLEHISATMNNCAQQLRAGRDQEAMTTFARGTTDLSYFVQLVDQVATVAKAQERQGVCDFKIALHSCVKNMEQSMVQQDLVSLSDQIEDELLPLLPSWPKVRNEIEEGIDAQAS